MFHYRVLLVDTAAAQERPVQAFFPDLPSAEKWARDSLRTAHKGAEVVFYCNKETEMGTMKRDDAGTISGIQPAR